MITKTKLGIGLLATTFSGWGTYELLRTRGTSSSLDKNDNAREVDDEKFNEKPAKDEEKVPDEKNPNSTPDQKPKEEIPKPQIQTYKEYLISRNKNLKLVDEQTSTEVLKNILLHRMFPHYRQPFKFSTNNIFTDSPEISFTGNNVQNKSKDKTLYILKKNDDASANSLRDTCIKALNKNKPEDKDGVADSQTYRLKAWCTVPTIRDVLLRHKFKLPQNDEWKKILESEWIKDEKYHEKQSLFTKDEMQQLRQNSDENKNIKLLKDKCTNTLSKPFERTNFPAPRDFLEGGKKSDEFQEAALFCTVPITAEEYVKTAMQGDIHTSIPKEFEKDYCYETGKEVNYYKDIKTTDPMGGKSFWCAVRMIYHKQTPKKS